MQTRVIVTGKNLLKWRLKNEQATESLRYFNTIHLSKMTYQLIYSTKATKLFESCWWDQKFANKSVKANIAIDDGRISSRTLFQQDFI